MILKSLIIDDDSMARKALEKLCESEPQIQVIASFENAEKAIEWMAEETPDLIFLDVEMPGISGIEFLERLPVMPMVIFTTGNQQYAFEAFEAQAVDFLKKPILRNRFKIAVQKAITTSEQAVESSSSQQDIYVKENGRLIRIELSDILYFENVGDYVRVKTENSSHILHGTMKGIDHKITDPRFLKVHRSYIVNLHKIKDIEENTLVIDKTVIPISRAHK
ncbi:MAG: LytTR family DNA-binding domain-containing protein, partial [Saprospiraceae bacterium]